LEGHDHVGSPEIIRRYTIPRIAEELLNFVDTGDCASAI
jgi:hypothetical protein